MGIWQKLGIVESVPDENKPTEKTVGAESKKSVFNFKGTEQQTQPQQTPPPTQNYVPVSPSYNPYNASGANPEYVETFRTLVKDKNFPGLDFQEFIAATKSPELQGLPEQARFAAAYSIGFKMNGVPKSKLVETGEKYVQAIDDEINSIEQSFQQTQNQNLTKQKLIENKQGELLELQKKQQAINDEINRLNQEIVETNTVMSSNKNSLVASANVVKAELQTDLEKVKNYLPE